jgi:hypothetical protein
MLYSLTLTLWSVPGPLYLHHKVPVKIGTKLCGLEVSESEPKGLQWFAIGKLDEEVALGDVQAFYLEAVFVRPKDRLPFVNSHRKRRRIIEFARSKESWWC